MRFSEETLNRVRDENPIEDVIGDFLDIKKSGENFKTKCPFHTEKTPSFFVSPEKGIYHCFGCGKSGNVITFLMDYRGMTFPEAVKFLAERAGIEIEGEEEKNVDILKVLEYASQLYHKTLLETSRGRPGRAYLESRKIDDNTIVAFKLGYAPISLKYLVRAAQKKNIKLELLNKAGLVKDGLDKFKKRIMFPVFNTGGRVIGFGSRMIDEGQPKYMNSPDTEVYKKSYSLYGLYQTKGDIRKEKTAILVEGNIDLLSVWQAGVKNVVASLGTSLTDGQTNLLARYAKKVVMFYDSDEAGLKSSRRAIDILLRHTLDVRIAVIASGYDPDSLVREKGINYEGFLRNTVDFLEFIINAKKVDNPEDKIVLISEVKRTLNLIRDPIKKEVWTSEASKRLDISKSLLAGSDVGTTNRKVPSSSINIRCRAEAEILGFALKYESVWDNIKKEEKVIQTPVIREIIDRDHVDPEGIMEMLEPDLRSIVGNILLSVREKGMDLEQVNYLIRKVKNWDMKSNLRNMRETIRRMEKNNESVKELLLEYEKMRRRSIEGK